MREALRDGFECCTAAVTQLETCSHHRHRFRLLFCGTVLSADAFGLLQHPLVVVVVVVVVQAVVLDEESMVEAF